MVGIAPYINHQPSLTMHSLLSSPTFILDQRSSLGMARVWDCDKQGPPPKTTAQPPRVNLRVKRVIAPLPRRPIIQRRNARSELKRKRSYDPVDDGPLRKETCTENLQTTDRNSGQNSTSATAWAATQFHSTSSYTQNNVEWGAMPRISHLERVDPLYDEEYDDPFEDDAKTLVGEPLSSPCEDVEMGE